ncbi:two-component regulator propeller domain-containing protein [Ravibacter arvi]|uniref:histidine kinase n=2 Tax=Ravibacter arvi TaxID=2051041 RepID=A0ABP8M3B3_9BACT
MWFAQPKGLNRYDGRSFKKYGLPAEDSDLIVQLDSNFIAPIYIHCVQPDSKGNLWAGTGKGLYRYDKKKDIFSFVARHDSIENKSLSHNSVHSIFEDKQKRLWVGTREGLDLVTFKDGKATVTRKLPATFQGRSRSVRSIAEGSDGTLWLGTYDGLIRFRGEGDAKLFRRTSKIPSTVLNEFIEVFVDKKGTVWVGSNEPGLIKFNKTEESFTTVSSFRDPTGSLPIVNVIRADSSGRYWLATESGLARFDPDKNTGHWYRRDAHNPYSLSDNVLYSQFIDNQGGLWLGSYYWGVNYWHPDSPTFSVWPTETHAVPYKYFANGWAGSASNGSTWILSNDRSKLFVIVNNQEQSRLYTLKIPTPEIYHHFLLDTNNVFWCAGHTGLYRLDLDRNKARFFSFKETAGRTNNLIRGKSGNIWLAGGFGLLKFRESDGTFEAVKGVKENVRCVFEDSQKRIWVDGDGEVSLLSPDGTLLDSYKTNSGYNFNKFVEDARGHVWAVFRQTLVKFDPKKKQLGFEKVLAGEFWDIEIDKGGFLWLCQRTRLTRYDPDKKRVQTFGYREGLPLNSLLGYAVSFKDGESYLYFTTTNEIFRFDPAAIKNINAPSPVVLTSLRLFNQKVAHGDNTGILDGPLHQARTLRFRHDQNVFALDFSLLSYFKADANRFAYRLEGFDKDWNLVNTPSATYTNLPAGTYNFEVKAVNGDGVWTNRPLALEIIILPPWWKTWYAYLFYLVVIGAVIYAINRFFWLQTSFRKENALNQVKLDFFTNVSHEIRTHLSLISGPLEKAHAQLQEGGGDVAHNLNCARGNSDRLMQLVNELLDFRKIQSGGTRLLVREHDVVKIVKSVLAAFEHVGREKEIRTTLICPDTPVLLWFDIAQMQKVFYNLLSNAYKFTPAGGKISVRITEVSHEVKISVADTGSGISPEHLKKLFTYYYQADSGKPGYGIGLALSKSIVEQHHGYLTAESRLSTETTTGGTTLTIRLLQENRHFSPDQIAPKNGDYLTGMFTEQAAAQAAPYVAAGKLSNTILIIEDNDELRAFIRELFEGEFNTIEAGNGRLGLELANEHVPDIILCDVMMPEMNGLEVCRNLKNNISTVHIPVVLLTARTQNEQIIEGLAAGADDYLVKPFDPRIVSLKINNLIHLRDDLKERYRQAVLAEPETANNIAQDQNEAFIRKLKSLVTENISDPGFGVNELARHAGMSVSVLYRKMRSLTGMTINEFVKTIRFHEAKRLLESGVYQVGEVATLIGFEDTKYFSREFVKIFGQKPNEIKKQRTV